MPSEKFLWNVAKLFSCVNFYRFAFAQKHMCVQKIFSDASYGILRYTIRLFDSMFFEGRSALNGQTLYLNPLSKPSFFI